MVFLADVDSLRDRADAHAFCVVKIQETHRNDEDERLERKKRQGNLRVYGIEELNSEDPVERVEYNLMKVQEVFSSLGVTDVSVRNLERLKCQDGETPRLRITPKNKLDEIIRAYKKGGKRFGGKIWITPDFTPFMEKWKKLSLKECNMRNEICRLRSDPWRWTMKNGRVVPMIDEIKNDPEAMQRLADELKERVEMFQRLAVLDKEYRADCEDLKTVIFKNVRYADGFNTEKADRTQVNKVLSVLGVNPNKVTSVERKSKERLLVTVEDRKTKDEILEKSKTLHLSDTIEEWMESIEIKLARPYVEKYCEKMLYHERGLRRRVSSLKGESCQWIIRSGKVVKLSGDGVADAHARDHELERDLDDSENEDNDQLDSSSLQIFSVASQKGIGCYFQGKWASHMWPLGFTPKNTSTYHLELIAAAASIFLWAESMQNMNVTVNSDNQDVVRMITQGSSTYPQYQHILHHLDLVCLTYNIVLQAKFCPSDKNAIADSLSKNLIERFRYLAPSAERERSNLSPAHCEILFSKENQDSDLENDLADDDLKKDSKHDPYVLKLAQDGIIFESDLKDDDSDLENDLAEDDLKRDSKYDPDVLKLAQDGIVFETNDSEDQDNDLENDLADDDLKKDSKHDPNILKLAQDGIIFEANEPEKQK